MRVRRTSPAWTLLAVAFTPLTGGDDGGLPVPGQAPAACHVRELERRRVETAGRHLYVEAQSAGSAGNRTFLLGQPTYEWIPNRGDRLALAGSNDFLGVLIDDEAVQTIDFPPGVTHVSWVRGVRLAGDRWGFVMEEVDGPAVQGTVPLRVLYAEYRFAPGAPGPGEPPGRWGEPETLPVRMDPVRPALPAGHPVVNPATNAVVWAATVPRPRSIDVVLFERSPSEWSQRIAAPDWVDHAAVHFDREGRITVVVAGLDPLFEAQRPSVRLLRPPDREVLRRLEVGLARQRFRNPVFAATDEPDPALAWITSATIPGESSQAHVMTSADRHEGPIRVLDPSSNYVRYAGKIGETDLWITRHASLVYGEPMLRFALVGNGIVSVIGVLPYPFLGDFEVIDLGAGELLVVGPEADPASFTPFVRSLLIRLSIDCT